MNPNDYPIFQNAVFLPFFLIAVIWSAIWKAIALWKSARNNHLAWYIVLMIFNTLGILEIIYIYAIAKKSAVKASPETQTPSAGQSTV
ncbi:MAG: hypothetical protein UV19_C0004G0033 [Parcubacteria group bacterium GW2011_GWA2_42_28]|nr:MAG: hypothetical protein UV19_C0004G0033 [Parcubacteria group bacterium GW2011_GWA2_42_28]KKT55468.1 MAG: hypothetical protein UW45_C0007G0033 [Parcubacteria group bacterium GW2011_GWC2_44_22]